VTDLDTNDFDTPAPREHHRLIPSLRVVGGDLYRPGRGPEHELSLDDSRVTVIGREHGCDWLLPHEAVSRRAVTVTRSTLGRIHVAKHPDASKEPKRNRQAFGQNDLAPGDVFSLGNNHIMVKNVAMRRARPRVAWWLGETVNRETGVNDVDDVLAKVTQGTPILLLGEANLWPEQLARFLHDELSLRGPGTLVETGSGTFSEKDRAAFVQQCHGGGALFTLREEPPSRERAHVHSLVAELLEQRVAVFVTAPDLDVAQAVLKNDLRPKFRETLIAPIKDRRGEMDALLIGMVRRLNLPAHPTVYVANLPAMQAHLWPGNLTELSEVARNLAALATHSVNEAADSLGIARTTFKDWLKRYGFVATRSAGVSGHDIDHAAEAEAEAADPAPDGATALDAEDK
jgi:hypothetical protein